MHPPKNPIMGFHGWDETIPPRVNFFGWQFFFPSYAFFGVLIFFFPTYFFFFRPFLAICFLHATPDPKFFLDSYLQDQVATKPT